MKKIKLRNHWNFKLEARHKEKIEGKSMTLPDETMGIRELLIRHQKGMLKAEELMRPSNYNDPESFDEVDMQEIANSDLFDIEKEKLRLTERIKELRTKSGNLRGERSEDEASEEAERSDNDEQGESKRNDAEQVKE